MKTVKMLYKHISLILLPPIQCWNSDCNKKSFYLDGFTSVYSTLLWGRGGRLANIFDHDCRLRKKYYGFEMKDLKANRLSKKEGLASVPARPI